MMIVSVLYALILFLISCAVLIASFVAGARLRSGVFRKCLQFSLYLTVVCGPYFLNLRSLAFSGTGGSVIAGFFILTMQEKLPHRVVNVVVHRSIGRQPRTVTEIGCPPL